MSMQLQGRSWPRRLLPYQSGLLLLLILTGCAIQQHPPVPLDVQQTYIDLSSRDLDNPALREFMIEQGFSPPTWPLSVWNVDALTLAALYLNPDMQVAIAEWRSQQAGEITAAQRINPTMNLPLEWHTDTSEGQSPWLIGVVLDLVFERSGKRAARIERAELQTAAARIALQQAAWNVRSRVHEALAELGAARDSVTALEQRIEGVTDILGVLQRREELGQVAAFELSSNRLELQRLRLQLSQKQQMIDSARGRLATAIGVVPSQFAEIDVSLPAADSLPSPEQLPTLDIQGLALQHRYDIRRALTEYAAQEAALRLQIEKQYPDINLSPGFVFDQSDNVWALGSAWLLPLFHNHEGEIAEALAQRSLLQARFVSLQASIIDRVFTARNDYLGKLNTYKEARTLQADAEDYRRRIRQQLEAGYADRLQFLRARQITSEASQAVFDSRAGLLQAYAVLEKTLQYSLRDSNWSDAVVADLVSGNKAFHKEASNKKEQAEGEMN